MALDKTLTFVGEFNLAVVPEFGRSLTRTAIIEGLTPGNFKLFIDDDSSFADSGDASPANEIQLSEITVSGDSTTGKITLPNRLTSYLFLAPLISGELANSEVKVAELIYLDEDFNLQYAGAPTLYLGYANGGLRLPYTSNHPGELQVILEYNSTRYAVLTDKLKVPGGIFTWDGKINGTQMESRAYQSKIGGLSLTGEGTIIPGPEIVLDFNPPVVQLAGVLVTQDSEYIASLNYSYMDDESGIEIVQLRLSFGNEVIYEEVTHNPGNDVSDQSAISIPSGYVEDCPNCLFEAEIIVQDLGGNSASEEIELAVSIPFVYADLGVTSLERILPANIRDGYYLWMEDSTELGDSLSTGGVVYAKGVSGAPTVTGDYAWMLYDLHSEAFRLNILGVPINLTGFTGNQDGMGAVTAYIKTSSSELAPSESEWITNTGPVIEHMAVDSGLNVPINVSLKDARWLWIGVVSENPSTDDIGVFCNAKVLYGDDFSDWENKKKIFINTTVSGVNVNGDADGFPLLVRLSEQNFDFSSAKEDGGDLRFTNDIGTPLHYAIENWDIQNKVANVWVKTDVRGNLITVINMHWGNYYAADSSNSQAVFSQDEDFINVWHLNESHDTLAYDAAGNVNGTYMGALPNNQMGIIGYGQDFISSNASDYIDLTGIASSSEDKLTFTFWVKPSSFPGKDEFSGLFMADGSDKGDMKLQWNEKRMEFRLKGNTPKSQRSKFRFKTGKWYHVGVSYNSDEKKVLVYVNGNLTVVRPCHIKKAIPIDLSGDNAIGAWNGTVLKRFFDGMLDEFRISGTVRSVDWIKLSYESQRIEGQRLVSFQDSYTDWSHSMEVKFNTTPTGADVITDTDNFPVLVRLDSSNFNFSQAGNNGEDLRFTDQSGMPLFYEIEKWDKQKEVAEIWVLVSQVEGNSNTDFITMYWGNPYVEDESTHDIVFNKENGFVLVIHQERKVKGKHCFPHGMFDKYWKKFESKKYWHLSKFLKYAGKHDKLLPSMFHKFFHSSGNINKCSNKKGKHKGHKCKDKTFIDITFSWWSLSHHSGWNYYAYVLKDGNLTFYKNGILTNLKNNKSRHVKMVDEIRISDVARTSEWIKLNYENQKVEQVLVELP
ncbi:DUF2341 domain-containing protein [Fibrobacterota bacterium]